jgi:hypothetical protein
MPYNPALYWELSIDECKTLLFAAQAELVRDFPNLTPRCLDHQIWLYQRQAAVRVKHLT